MVKPKSAKRAAKRATRKMRTGSSTNAGETWRNILDFISAWPLKGSINLSSSDKAMALMVRSRRIKSSSSVTSAAA